MTRKVTDHTITLAVALLVLFTVSVNAGSPVITAPPETTSARRPTVSWTSVPGATWHRIYIASGPPGFAKAYHDEWMPGATSWEPDWDLPTGQYVVWVRAWGPNDVGGWSGPHEFARRNPSIVSGIDGVYYDGGNIDLVAGANVTITPDDANNRITFSALGGGGGAIGDITAVHAGSGLSGGGTENDVTLSLAQNSVDSSEVVDNSLTSLDLAANSVSASEIAAGAVGTSEVADGSLRGVDLADNAVTSAKIQNGQVTSSDIQDGAVSTSDIKNGTIALNDLALEVARALVPAGTIVAYGGYTPPSGWLECDGRALDRSSYSSLYSAIGTRWGTPNSSQFNVPDLRGMFLRGYNGTRSDGYADPDRSSRSRSNPGGYTGNNVGTIQADSYQSQTHDFEDTQLFPMVGSIMTGSGIIPVGTLSLADNTAASGSSSETRPNNAYVKFIIKY